MRHNRTEPPGTGLRARLGFTLVELLIVIGIVAVLAAIAVQGMNHARVRANVARSRGNLKVLAQGLELYRADFGAYPIPRVHPPEDPLGVVSATALDALAKPGSYLTSRAFEDPFGAIKVQGSSSRLDLFGFPMPTFNPARSMLYFHYPSFSRLIGDPALDCEGFAVISLGPDEKDSFGVYMPFPDRLPPRSADYGVRLVEDTVYDPTNGTVSRGDVAVYGGDLATINSPR